MMGGHHAISGTAAWLALAGSAQVAGRSTGIGVLDLTATEVLAGAVVTTGAALLPDIDHPGATISRSAGGASKLLTSAVGSVAGHRGATHTLLAVAAFTLLAALVARLDWRWQAPVLGEVQMGAVLVVAVMCAFATRALKVVTGALLPWVIGLASGVVVAAFAPETTMWLPASIALGVLVHLAGDFMTTDGIPFPTWPLVVRPKRTRNASSLWHPDGNVALPILGNAGSTREWVLCSAMSLYVGVAIAATVIDSWSSTAA
ncbi:metal-dependent hydrolase [Brachybacterium sacelli]|uniref:Membrane-bound metal-dependent hydrolase YbcI (DUF457 family) n=1 Tax=Brachybacterium sacelli TaxID=173364 RepID=A0ABS4X5K0_9MICO|nr:metal-dependent hydrolase [Brachybacterium sacelli]MBP2383735.1 membrane-bound metal-dependent hydrolase YbcI (DUF457 family) [Brachybacterium sacelli]